jgi:hypothetical protein
MKCTLCPFVPFPMLPSVVERPMDDDAIDGDTWCDHRVTLDSHCVMCLASLLYVQQADLGTQFQLVVAPVVVKLPSNSPRNPPSVFQASYQE